MITDSNIEGVPLDAASIEAISELSRRAQEAQPIALPEGSSEVVKLPDGTLHALDKYLPRPMRVEETPVFVEVASFTDYVQRFETGNSVTFFERKAHGGYLAPMQALAVLDYHEPRASDVANPRWGAHSATLEVPYSLQWQAWAGQEREKIGNAAMARFLEQNCEEIVVPEHDPNAPDQGVMMDVALKFEARRSIAFRSATKLQSGDTNLVFQQETQGGATKEGAITVPQYFWIQLPIIEGCDAFQIKCWFRYRIGDGGELSLWFEFHRADYVVKEAADALVEVIDDGLLGPVYVGSR